MPVYDPNLVTGVGRSCVDVNKTTFAGMSIAEIRTWYTAAQRSYLDLVSGGKPVTVSYEGKSVTYTAADANRLKSLIDEAQAILGYGRQRRALTPIFR